VKQRRGDSFLGRKRMKVFEFKVEVDKKRDPFRIMNGIDTGEEDEDE